MVHPFFSNTSLSQNLLIHAPVITDLRHPSSPQMLYTLSNNLRQVQILGGTANIIAGTRGPDKVVLWDVKEDKQLGEIELNSSHPSSTPSNTIPTNILSLKFSGKNYLMVQTRQKIYRFLIKGGIHLLSSHTNILPDTLMAVSRDSGHLAFSYDNQRGIDSKESDSMHSVQIVLPDTSETRSFLIGCHKSPIVCLALSNDGHFLATASHSGTLIRIWDLKNENLPKNVSFVSPSPWQVLRRGSVESKIYHLTFSPDNQFLALTSDKPTVHIFTIKRTESEVSKNSRSLFGLQDGEKAFAHSRWDGALKGPSMCEFGNRFINDKCIIWIVSCTGEIVRLSFNKESGGECSHKSFTHAFDPEAECR